MVKLTFAHESLSSTMVGCNCIRMPGCHPCSVQTPVSFKTVREPLHQPNLSNCTITPYLRSDDHRHSRSSTSVEQGIVMSVYWQIVIVATICVDDISKPTPMYRLIPNTCYTETWHFADYNFKMTVTSDHSLSQRTRDD